MSDLQEMLDSTHCAIPILCSIVICRGGVISGSFPLYARGDPTDAKDPWAAIVASRVIIGVRFRRCVGDVQLLCEIGEGIRLCSATQVW